MSNIANQQDSVSVFRRMIEAANDHDIEALVSSFAPDYTADLPLTPGMSVAGQQDVRRNWSMFFSTMADFRVEIVRIIGSSDQVWAELVFRGTHADGTTQQILGVNIAGIEDGKIVWGRLYQSAVSYRATLVTPCMTRSAALSTFETHQQDTVR